jgi:aspartate--ammonia ligase
MKDKHIIPVGYCPLLDVNQTEKAIKQIKDFFQTTLATELNLTRVTAPLFVEAGKGINDDLNGVEKPVSFLIRSMNGTRAEIVQSLAKWKRLTLSSLGVQYGHGIYTDMNAIRPDEALDNLHSLYVDQWDWERVISDEERTLDFLITVVQKIYEVLKRTEWQLHSLYPQIKPLLPDHIKFIHAEELAHLYPQLPPPKREDLICKEYGAVFIIGIGAPLSDGQPHDSRAPDYDDWISPTGKGKGLNGDILVWYPLLNRAMEISSMGIRVNAESLEKQLEFTQTTERRNFYFHQKLLAGDLPDSIGGGIGQSRLCTFFLRKAHIGEIQVSLWPTETIAEFKKHNVTIL